MSEMSLNKKNKLQAYEEFFNLIYIARNVSMDSHMVIRLLENSDALARAEAAYEEKPNAVTRARYALAISNLAKVRD